MYLAFVRGVSATRTSRIGVVLVTSSLLTMIALELLRIAGVLTNAYIGLITYMGLPAVFLVGLVLIPVGWRIWSKRTGRPLRELLSRRFAENDLEAQQAGSRLIKTVLALTLINVVFLTVVSLRMLHFMDQASFCGTACHKVMNPEWTTYQQSPHARVRCVDCHVGEGVQAAVDAKLNGMWQIISATFHLYEKPIPTPVRNLRPARETCEKCHWPEMFLGNRTLNIHHYELDGNSTPKYTTLVMKVGAGTENMAQGIHWHVAAKNEVQYASVGDEREEMIWVDARQPDGSYRRFRNTTVELPRSEREVVRTMDCVDCHNRATHIYEQPEPAVDRRIQLGLIDRSLPFIKERALGALIANYPSREKAMAGTDAHIRNFYRAKYPALSASRAAAIDSAVAAVQAVWARNIHPYMRITWGSYANHLGHRSTPGCFRCHNPNLVDDSGHSISMDCTLCHSILANEEDEPYKYLFAAGDSVQGARDMQEYLRDEFWRSTRE